MRIKVPIISNSNNSSSKFPISRAPECFVSRINHIKYETSRQCLFNNICCFYGIIYRYICLCVIKNDRERSQISLIKDVNTAGGLVRFTDGLTAPAAEPSWTELGATILLAHEALKADGVVIGLHSYDVDTTSE
jgi:hypothetical protein